MCYKNKLIPLYGLILLVSAASVNPLHAQNKTFYTQNYAQKSLDIQKNGMIVLGSWAILNTISGSAGYFLSEQPVRYFHQMNAAWNMVNLGIAGFALNRILKTDPSTLSYTETLNRARKLDQFLLLNAGLDMAYMAAGAWIWERGIRKNSDQLRGYGQSMVLQGGFLLVFDLILYSIHSPVTGKLVQINDNISLNGTGVTIHF